MKLYIIGNGFDLAHGIPSSYSDFMKFVGKKDRRLDDYLNSYYPAEDLWKNFEYALGNISSNQIVKVEEAEFIPSKEDFDEKNLHAISDTITYKTRYINGNLLSVFVEWLESINTSSAVRKNSLALSSNDLYFSFNYTDTLEKVYGIPYTQIKHIHGTTDNPIYGHTSGQCKVYAPEEDCWSITDEADDMVKELFHKTRKPVDEIIKREKAYFQTLASVDEVYVMGHSLNDIDVPYYEEIIRSISSDAKWIVYYHDDKDKEEFRDKLSSLGVAKARITLQNW